MTPDRHVGHEMGALNWPVFLRHLYAAGAKLTPDHSLESVRKVDDGRFQVALRNDYSNELVERT